MFSSWKGVQFCQVLFLQLLKWSGDIILYSFNMTYYIDWFSYVKPTLLYWNKSQFVMCIILFICCYTLFSNILVSASENEDPSHTNVFMLLILSITYMRCSIWIWASTVISKSTDRKCLSEVPWIRQMTISFEVQTAKIAGYKVNHWFLG